MPTPIPAPDATAIEWERKPQGYDGNLKDYNKTCESFDWKSVEKEFTWSKTGKVNIVHEAIDRHAQGKKADQIALHYTDWAGRTEKYTFADLKRETSKFANALKALGIKKGDRVGAFLPRAPELYIAILGMHRIGAIPVPLFEAFMEQAVEDRLGDSGAIACVTTAKLKSRIPLKKLPALKTLVLTGAKGKLEKGEFSWDAIMEKADEACEPEWLTIDDGLVLHYTSGSTGRAKGVLHRQYAMIGHYQTAKWALDLRDDDIYWCTADPGWVTGTSYGIYGPWTLGVTSVVVGGRFDADLWWKTIQEYKVTMWYSAPTAFRMLMSIGEEIPKKYNFKSLRHVCSVGEPLNPEALKWIKKITGLAPHETWWMTETGMQLICNYRSEDFKIGATGKPFPGTYASVVDDSGKEVPPGTLGNLVVKPGWPAMMVEIWNNKKKYDEYFRIPGWYTSGDTAFKDEDGFIWYQGRADDVIKTAGERVGPFEVESALVAHPAVAEAGVIGKPDEIRGAVIKAFIALRQGYEPSDKLKEEIAKFVKTNMAAHAAPREIEFVPKVPKTRSGKIMRRVLRAWDQGTPVGDVSTMEE